LVLANRLPDKTVERAIECRETSITPRSFRSNKRRGKMRQNASVLPLPNKVLAVRGGIDPDHSGMSLIGS
jgi:hypothetical protein